MNKIGLIIRREYLTRVKKKSFIIMTFLGPLLMVGIFVGAIMLGLADTTDHKILIVDKTPTKVFENKFKNEEKIEFFYSTKNISNAEFEKSPYTLLLYLNEETVTMDAGEIFYKESPGFRVLNQIRAQVEEILENYKLELNKISRKEYEHIKTDFNLVGKDIHKDKDDSFKDELSIVGFGFAIVIYLFIFMYGVQVMRGVLEEKTNRIVEVLISSVKPFELMMGKILGIGLVALTQFLLWVVLTASLYIGSSIFLQDKFNPEKVANEQVANTAQQEMKVKAVATPEMMENIQKFMDELPLGMLLGMFVFYFIGGYLVYASLFAAVGAAVDNETDTQQFMFPITIPLVFGFVVAEMSMVNHGGAAATWFSLFPLTSPVVMMVRVAQGLNFEGPDMWQLLASMVLLIGFFIFCVWLAGKIYRTGILLYGKKATYKELWKWLFYKG